MIGAASGLSLAASGPSGMAGAGEGRATARDGSREDAGAGRGVSTSRAESPATGAAARRDAAQRSNDAKTSVDDPNPGPGEFAALMESNAGASPAPPATTTTADTATTPVDTTTPTGLPDQLLALLGGAWAVPPAASPAAAPAATPLADGLTRPATTPVLPTLNNAAAVAGAALATATATPTATAATSASDSAAFAALAAAVTDTATAGDDRGKSDLLVAADASLAPDPTVLAAVPSPAAIRASAPPPSTAALVLPADPDAGFDDAFGGRIAWMAEQRIGHADIRISPEHVGPIDVRVQLDGNRVSAEFHSANADVRQALEASLPRLRELLGQHGLQLGQADIGQRHAGHGSAGRGERGEPGNGFGDASADDARVSLVASRLRSRGLLDEYA